MYPVSQILLYNNNDNRWGKIFFFKNGIYNVKDDKNLKKVEPTIKLHAVTKIMRSKDWATC